MYNEWFQHSSECIVKSVLSLNCIFLKLGKKRKNTEKCKLIKTYRDYVSEYGYKEITRPMMSAQRKSANDLKKIFQRT